MENSSLHAINSRPILLALLFLTLLLSITACTKRSRGTSQVQDQQSQSSLKATSQQQPQRININTASPQELEALPGIGKALAERIIEHREKYGPFRRPEHLLIVRGISDKRFQNLRDLITVE
jgi:competence ComEA-like helix-hairpin-helix protein